MLDNKCKSKSPWIPWTRLYRMLDNKYECTYLTIGAFIFYLALMINIELLLSLSFLTLPEVILPVNLAGRYIP